MIALCAHAGGHHLYPQTVYALDELWAGEVDYAFINPKDEHGYETLLAKHWAKGEDFAVIEPDIVIHGGVSEAFHDCPEPYCCFPYAWLTQVGPALGCTRFRAGFLREFPDVIKKAGAHNVSWRQLDVVLMRHVLARDYKQQPHVHLPAVEHLNPRKQLAPDADPTPVLTVPTR